MIARSSTTAGNSDVAAQRPSRDEPVRLLLENEPRQAGEDEVATALRLPERVIGSYPRASDPVLAHALYAVAPFFNFLPAHGKHAVAVLKQERRQLYQDVAGLFVSVPPREGTFRNRKCCGGIFRTCFRDHRHYARASHSFSETYPVRRQLDGKDKVQTSDWIRATTLPVQPVSTERAVGFGHQRWDNRSSRVQSASKPQKALPRR